MTMSVDRTTSATREDDTPTTAAGENTDRSAERTSSLPASPDDGRADQRAEPRTREEYADAMRAGGGPMSRDNSQDSPESAQDQQGADHQPETITFDNKDIEVTHNTADGIWIEGLPGEPPTRIGDLVRSAEDPAQGRGEKLHRELNKEAENITDTSGKWADYVREILDNPRPTHSMTHSRPSETAISGAEHGINAGHGAEAFLTLAIVGAAAVHKLHERLQRAWEH
jgi:hypothetical protein